jgi:hypothetical protein
MYDLVTVLMALVGSARSARRKARHSRNAGVSNITIAAACSSSN